MELNGCPAQMDGQGEALCSVHCDQPHLILQIGQVVWQLNSTPFITLIELSIMCLEQNHDPKNLTLDIFEMLGTDLQESNCPTSSIYGAMDDIV